MFWVDGAVDDVNNFYYRNINDEDEDVDESYSRSILRRIYDHETYDEDNEVVDDYINGDYLAKHGLIFTLFACRCNCYY